VSDDNPYRSSQQPSEPWTIAAADFCSISIPVAVVACLVMSLVRHIAYAMTGQEAFRSMPWPLYAFCWTLAILASMRAVYALRRLFR
jgi:hypothetical protein